MGFVEPAEKLARDQIRADRAARRWAVRGNLEHVPRHLEPAPLVATMRARDAHTRGAGVTGCGGELAGRGGEVPWAGRERGGEGLPANENHSQLAPPTGGNASIA